MNKFNLNTSKMNEICDYYGDLVKVLCTDHEFVMITKLKIDGSESKMISSWTNGWMGWKCMTNTRSGWERR